jgi:GNAT superfamily N-acetyltransferase
VHEVRKATEGDVPGLASALARAFEDDPVFTWVFPRDGSRRKWSRRFFLLRLRQMLPQQEIYAIPDVGAAAWALPGRWELGAREFAAQIRLLPGIGSGVARVLRGMSAMEARHPDQPHFYLAHLGVDPERQGAGVGSALIAPVLRACDADGVSAYLESSKERNLDFYARHGFRVTDRLTLPKGPPVWQMWRDAR